MSLDRFVREIKPNVVSHWEWAKGWGGSLYLVKTKDPLPSRPWYLDDTVGLKSGEYQKSAERRAYSLSFRLKWDIVPQPVPPSRFVTPARPWLGMRWLKDAKTFHEILEEDPAFGPNDPRFESYIRCRVFEGITGKTDNHNKNLVYCHDRFWSVDNNIYSGGASASLYEIGQFGREGYEIAQFILMSIDDKVFSGQLGELKYNADYLRDSVSKMLKSDS